MRFAWFNKLRAWWAGRKPGPSARAPLKRVVLTDGVTRTLMDGYASHRRSPRGAEEIGWVLLGYRQGDSAVAMAALPAGMERDAGAAHVLFNPHVQELASRILRQADKRLQIVGVVHTHPGNLRQPSGGDLEGDRVWVEQLPSGDAVFAIGTADAHAGPAEPHQQCYAELCFSWYSLARGEAQYRKLPFQVSIGPDLAAPLHLAWELLEQHARVVNRLYRLFAKVVCEVLDEDAGAALAVRIALPEPGQQLRLLLTQAAARYYWERDGELIAIDPCEPQIDRAVCLILAELAKAPSAAEAETLVES